MPLPSASVTRIMLACLLAWGLAGPSSLAQDEAAPPAMVETDLRPGLSLDTPQEAEQIEEIAAEPGAETAQASAADLDQVEASLTLSRDRIEALKSEIAAMEGDTAQQNAALIAAAQRVTLAEIEVADVEERLSDLIVREFAIRGRLDGADAEIANVLAALQRISLNPPPALIVDPDDALGSARGAMLIAAIVPQLRERADQVAADLAALTEIKTAALAEEATLKANHEVLEEEQLRIATLIAARKQGVTRMSAELAAEEAEAVELAERASTLRELIGALSERAAAGATAAPADIDADLPQLSPEAIHLAFANAARTQPAVPFALTRGYLARPANGAMAMGFGANDGKGGIAQGQSLLTPIEAQVLAPADGWVLYKGPYLNYGQIVILNAGNGYTALLAGLDTISAEIGQFVQMGEPLGQMGSRTIGRTVTTSAGNAQPTLYIEFRRNNEPFDPAGWWADNEQTG
ncbi:murein hydrolase activator EnvC family protein [Devosia faecipullorum]|uniref:murein hydrolase activator EnvC family protein n=1 Tax=Devosia faecipullorum TaxID=2755039 RepID=UPI00187BBE9B|nr:peptidoglycan DD-metalloendopeptidase family protein [Devosia faecipullorum]MBE7732813.1 peptidoglycan DD-metalloendopeptidase family protein [Devosia faecipullorum]